MSYRQEQRANYWAEQIAKLPPGDEQARHSLGWRIMELEEELERYKAAVGALDAALNRAW